MVSETSLSTYETHATRTIEARHCHRSCAHPIASPMSRPPQSSAVYEAPCFFCGIQFSFVRALTCAALLSVALLLIYAVCSRRILDFSDEGFYYTSAWLAYSQFGDLPATNLLMNFGKILGLPYLITSEPTILEFRLLSLSGWYLVHFAFFSAIRNTLGLNLSSFWIHVLSTLSLYVFLIPSLSYQNMPYLFALLGSAICLQLANSAKIWFATVLSFLLPLSVFAGVVAYSPFLVIASLFLCVTYWQARSWPGFSQTAFWSGAAIGMFMLALVFRLDTLRNYESAFAFFNSEVDYTNSVRLFEKIWGLARVVGRDVLAGAVIVLLALGIKRVTGHQSRATTGPLLVLYTAAVTLYFITTTFRTECVASCDATVIFLIDVTFAGLPLLAFFIITEKQNPKAIRAIGVLLCLYLATGLFIGTLSNAPYQYNLKFMSPALLGALLLLVLGIGLREGTPSRMVSWILVALFFLTSLEVTLLSNYGAVNRAPPRLWTSTIPLPGSNLRGLYGDSSRARLIEMLKTSYANLGCQNEFFAAVDSTMLAYYLLQRKPPFPHAWVATRVAASRDVITAQPSGCVVMQDRVLAGTPADATTMLGYLRLDATRDQVLPVSLGDGFYLVRFSRQRGASN
jgi:hypothetical protein